MSSKKPEEGRSRRRPPRYAYQQIFADALDRVLQNVAGQNGKVLSRFIFVRYHLDPIELALKPNEYMNALRELLGSTAQTVELSILDEIRRLTNVSASTLEEAVVTLKKDPKYAHPLFGERDELSNDKPEESDTALP